MPATAEVIVGTRIAVVAMLESAPENATHWSRAKMAERICIPAIYESVDSLESLCGGR